MNMIEEYKKLFLESKDLVKQISKCNDELQPLKDPDEVWSKLDEIRALGHKHSAIWKQLDELWLKLGYRDLQEITTWCAAQMCVEDEES